MTDKQQSKSLVSVSPTDTKDSSSLEALRAKQRNQVQTSLRSTSVTGIFKATNQQAWVEGTNILTCLRIDAAATRAAVLSMIKITSDYIDAKRRLQTDADYIMVAEMIFHDFPTIKIEEIRLVMDRMKLGKYGEYYERLKAPEFHKCFRKHESDRAYVLENLHQHITRGADDPTNVPEYDAEAAKLAWRMKQNPYLIPDKNSPTPTDD